MALRERMVALECELEKVVLLESEVGHYEDFKRGNILEFGPHTCYCANSNTHCGYREGCPVYASEDGRRYIVDKRAIYETDLVSFNKSKGELKDILSGLKWYQILLKLKVKKLLSLRFKGPSEYGH